MNPLPPWLIRDNPEDDPNLIGAITHAKVTAALVAAGKTVLAPVANVAQYDLVIEDQGTFRPDPVQDRTATAGGDLFPSPSTSLSRSAQPRVGTVVYASSRRRTIKAGVSAGPEITSSNHCRSADNQPTTSSPCWKRMGRVKLKKTADLT